MSEPKTAGVESLQRALSREDSSRTHVSLARVREVLRGRVTRVQELQRKRVKRGQAAGGSERLDELGLVCRDFGIDLEGTDV